MGAGGAPRRSGKPHAFRESPRHQSRGQAPRGGSGMNSERLLKVIVAPVISEKATLVGEMHRQVVFEVVPDATKAEIKAAVELLFKEQKVQVATVNVVNVKGKEKRHGRFVGRRKSIKKAYVSLKGDGDINFVEGVA